MTERKIWVQCGKCSTLRLWYSQECPWCSARDNYSPAAGSHLKISLSYNEFGETDIHEAWVELHGERHNLDKVLLSFVYGDDGKSVVSGSIMFPAGDKKEDKQYNMSIWATLYNKNVSFRKMLDYIALHGEDGLKAMEEIAESMGQKQ